MVAGLASRALETITSSDNGLITTLHSTRTVWPVGSPLQPIYSPAIVEQLNHYRLPR